jgi:hypothetical protein
MNLIVRLSSFASVIAAGLLCACGASNQESAVPETGVTNAQRSDSAVVGKVSRARCDREETCNNIGAGQRYASREVCMDQLRGGLANDLNADQCPRGIDEAQLDQCLSAIRGEACNHPLDTLSRIEKCRSSALCLK